MIVKVKQNKKVIFSFLFRWANNKTCDNQRYTKSPIKTKGLFNFEKLPAAWGHYINLLNSASPAALVGIVGSIHLVLQSVNKEGKFLSSAPADTLCHWHHTNHVVLKVTKLRDRCDNINQNGCLVVSTLCWETAWWRRWRRRRWWWW